MAAPTLNESLEEFITGKQETGVISVAKGLNEGTVQLVELIEKLGPFLTSKENDIRGRGTLLLSEVLHRLPRNKLKSEEASLLVAFFCDRLKDHHSITSHTIYGILSLSTLTSLPPGDAAKICLHIFKEAQVQTLVQADRQNVFSILSNFLYSKLEELRQMGSEFVYGFIQAMDGEKDPRNLVMAFQIATTLIDHFPIDIFVEELFEVTSCYFPIDFRPPPNDPHGIGTEKLVQGLRSCLAGTAKFAEFCLPLLMEKLSSELQGAKIDAFETLATCAPVYGAKHLKDYLEAVWSCCRKEVFQSLSQDIEQAALGCLCCVVKAVSDDKQEDGAMFSLDCFLDEILKECRKHITEPDLRFIHPVCRLLQAVASASEAVCSKVLAFTLPILLDQFEKHPQAKDRQNLLSILQAFIRVSTAFPYADFPNPVSFHKAALLSVFVTVLSETNSSLKSVSAVGLGVLVETKGLLVEDDVVQVAEHMTKAFLSQTNEDLRQECLNTLSRISTHYQDITSNHVLSAFLDKLNTESMEIVEGHSGSHFVPPISHHALLTSMASLATQPSLVEHIVNKLLDHLWSITTGGEALSRIDECVTTCQSILSIVTKNRSDSTSLTFFYKKLLPEILQKSIMAALTTRSEVNSCHPLCREEVVVILAAIVRSITQFLDSSSASVLCQQVTDVFHRHTLESIIPSEKLIPADAVFKPLEVTSPWPQTQLVTLLTACICSVQREVTIPDQSEVLSSMLVMSTSSDHSLTSTTAAKCLAGLVNKLTAGPELDQIIEPCKQHLSTILESSGDQEKLRQRALNSWIWLTKSVLLRSHPTCDHFISHLVGFFEDPVLGGLAAGGLNVILSESEDVLCPASHADVKLMYRQRLFLQLLPRIIDRHKNTAQETKKHYLQALSHLLHFVPRQVLLSELPPLMPLLVQSLHQEDSALYQSVLERLELLTHDAPGIISEYVDSVLPDLLRLAGYEASMKVRISALRCIKELTTLEHHIVFPHKFKVVRSLIPRLDDKKRSVRSEAVKARNAWFFLGSDSK